jgi:hypothetical protein
MKEFLRATFFIESDNVKVREQALNLVRYAADDRERAVCLFKFVRDGISYSLHGSPVEKERYRASATLARGYGFCVQKAVLLAAMLRAVSIPAALVFADIRNRLISEVISEPMRSDTFIYHCYNCILLDGKWVKAVCAFDQEICKRLNVPLVEFNGREDAIFPSVLADGHKFVTYLRHRGTYDDVPFEEMTSEWKRFYGIEGTAEAGKEPPA